MSEIDKELLEELQYIASQFNKQLEECDYKMRKALDECDYYTLQRTNFTRQMLVVKSEMINASIKNTIKLIEGETDAGK